MHLIKNKKSNIQIVSFSPANHWSVAQGMKIDKLQSLPDWFANL